ncbi:peptide chain release factor N(5)-glutamine methyltransferase [Lutibacter sp. B2]|nr:peptide chain release factor N(5)-glutamine methyltransferase [Lutibacter sp. B2]
MTIEEALKQAVSQMEKTTIRTPLLDAEVLLCHILQINRLYLFLNRKNHLTEEQYDAYTEFVEKRIAGVPVQYIINKQEFMALDFYVEEGVLIPRPDTEILVEYIIDWMKAKKTNEEINIADLGVGSGAITVSLAKYIPNAKLYGVDISQKALDIATKNAKANEVQITFVKGDLLEPLKELKLKGKLDVLVSNPPYIPKKDIDGLQIEVSKYEPRLALDGGEDGLNFYRRIVDEGYIYSKKGGLIALEVGHDQADDVVGLLKAKEVYTNIQKIKDLSGIERVVVALVDSFE